MKKPLTKILLLLSACWLSFSVLPANTAQKIVRVGWYESSFNHTDQHGRLSGYAYEYQLRIAANTDWEYEYVSGSWVELFEKLEKGEIDLLSDVSYTQERAGRMLFSDHPMGSEDFYLLTSDKDNGIHSTDLTSLNGKRIGVNRNSLQQQLLKDWLKAHNLKVTIVEYDGLEAGFLSSLESNEIDAIATNTAFSNFGHNKCRPIAQLGSSDYFFAINKDRPDLKNDLDRAMELILRNNYYYNQDLNQKYFSRNSFFQYLPDSEIEWLRQHGAIRIGYRDNYLPFCALDATTGEAQGLLGDFIDRVRAIFGDSGIRIEAIAYPTINDAINAVVHGEVDVAFPNGMSAYDTEKAGLLPADAFVKSAEMAVVRNNDYLHTDGQVRAAINAENPNYISLIREMYPNWEIVHFPSTDECLKGVADGEADLLLVSNYRLGILNETIEELSLKAVATGSVIPLTFATSRYQMMLYSIMSRMSHVMTDTEIHASLARYSETKGVASFSHFARNNVSIVLLSFLAIIAVFILLLWHSHLEHRRAVAASHAKSKFLFNMSHDIRTPMNAIMGYTELMSKNLDDKEKCINYLGKLHDSGKFLLNLINNVLEMARIESGKTTLIETPQRPEKILNTLHNLYAEMADKKGIHLETSFSTHTKCVYCDEVKLNEILLNLISNAYKYTPEGGTIRVTSEELPHQEKGYTTMRVIVSDTGIGMSQEYLPHIFEDFSREQTYTDSKITGTGLGMSIVKHYVELMGGTIEVESELGKGTTFTVTIPHRIADKRLLEDKETFAVEAAGNQGKRILLAEDNDLNAEIAIEILSASGYEVDRAEDGALCIERYEKAPAGTYIAILMDVQMPNLNGYEATRYIRHLKDKEKAVIPIIAMTANAFEEDKKDALRAGMNAHLSKPIQVDLLLQTLQTLQK